jgi:hypothetical protein
MTRHLLAAIDGTGSSDWRKPDGSNSHVHGFFRDFRTEARLKRYFDGPDNLGFECEEIGRTVVSWALEAAGIRTPPPRATTPPVPQLRMRRGLFLPMAVTTVMAPIEADEPSPHPGARDLRITLVGHSRGGLISIAVARSPAMA